MKYSIISLYTGPDLQNQQNKKKITEKNFFLKKIINKNKFGKKNSLTLIFDK